MSQYDDLLKVLAVVKNDEAYGERIEALRKEQMELAYAREIATTVQEAEKYKISARQDAEWIVEQAEKEAAKIRLEATTYVDKKKDELQRQKAITQHAKELQVEYEKKLDDLLNQKTELEKQRQDLYEALERHKHEARAVRELRDRYELKFRQITTIITS